MSDMHFETAAIHVGQDPDRATGAAIVPIYQTSTFVQQAVGRHKGFEYSRTDNPTRRGLEVCLAALEGAAHAISFGSGMAAIATMAMTLRSGDLVVIPRDGYGGTYRLFDKVMPALGLRYALADMTVPEKLDAVLADGAAMVLVETPNNPLMQILDLERIASAAHA